MTQDVEVTANIAASVVRALVAAGDAVSEGDTLLLVESMKMEIPVLAPVDGRVRALHVDPGDVVQEGDTLASIATG